MGVCAAFACGNLTGIVMACMLAFQSLKRKENEKPVMRRIMSRFTYLVLRLNSFYYRYNYSAVTPIPPSKANMRPGAQL